jgi:hypothetical protein
MDAETDVKHKFLADSNMTFQEVFDFACARVVPVLQGLAKNLAKTVSWKPLSRLPLTVS